MNYSTATQTTKSGFRSLFWAGSLISGTLLGLNPPGFGTQWLGIVAFFPLLLLLEKLQQEQSFSQKKRLVFFFAACWISGSLAASIGGYWITNSIHVFGHLPWTAALLITATGYGLEVGLQLFIYFGLPLLFIRKFNGWDLILRLAFVLALDPWYPKLIQWSYGGLTFSQFPLIEQVADLIGSSGLLLYSCGFSFLLIYWWRLKFDSNGTPRILFRALAIYLLFWMLGLSYGAWRLNNLEQQKIDSFTKSTKLNVLLIQPNFSLQNLASNPELAHSKREQNLEILLADSRKALANITNDKNTPKLLIWPESVYPDPFFKVAASREKVVAFARKHQTSILLATVDWKYKNGKPMFHGVSVLLGANGDVLGRYNKIFLIPFGETIPFSDWFPGIASWLNKYIANMSEFERGTDYTVFSLSEKIKLAAPICFDIFSPTVVRAMVGNGADLIANLSNLAWFGKTTASDNMVAVLRWRALENRVPVIFASNNGQSVFIGADGKNLGQQLGLFEQGSLSTTIDLQTRYSFFRENAEWIWGGFMFLFFVLLIPAQVCGKIFY
ncbi:MAG: apolipoprotein N-acyltransferase [SAR324 cluster bacterium]|nr:apolipoprotein N-acyltransferase [SAR324 cluster bacterium]MBL7034461.1 apolipoprotein N-acyltransferase [SAR324 cluster bacterium]